MTVGLVLILAAAALLLYNTWDADRAARTGLETVRSFEAAMDSGRNTAPQPAAAGVSPGAGPFDSDAAASIVEQEPCFMKDGVKYIGVIDIPALGVTVPVTDTWSYPNLKIAGCRYTGSVAGGGLVILAHSYARFFGHLSQLKPGDSVVFTDAGGVAHNYAVAEVDLLAPTEIEKMTDSGYALTLFSCNYNGKARVTVRCAAD